MGQPALSNSSHTVTEKGADYVLNFQRHELKYYIPKERTEVIIPELLRYMDMDPYSQKVGYYPIYSIYFDTEDWQSFHEKLDGIERRKKFKIRSYKPVVEPDDVVLVEVKEKNKDIILKRRTPVKAKHIPGLQRGELLHAKDAVYDEWRYNVIRNAIKPKVLIHYKRMAFKARGHSDCRITIDRDVQWAMVRSGTAFNAPVRDTGFSKVYSVLEIKFGNHPPKFVLDLIQTYNLRNDAISKFCESAMTHYNLIR